MNFEKLFDLYLKSPRFRKLSVRSKEIYLNCGGTLSGHFGSTGVEKLKRSDIIKLQAKYADTPAHANLLIRVASVVFGFAIDMDVMQFNPAARMKMLKVGSHAKWTPEEVRRVISIGDRRISVAVALAWYTGQRESDILGMKWECYDGEYISIVQQKTNLEMKIKAHPDLVSILDPIRSEPSHYIVSGQQRMSGQSFRNMLKRRTQKLHIEKVFHGIRKGVACDLSEKGSSLKEVAAIMGHKSIRMAAFYAEQSDSKVLIESAVGNMTKCA